MAVKIAALLVSAMPWGQPLGCALERGEAVEAQAVGMATGVMRSRTPPAAVEAPPGPALSIELATRPARPGGKLAT